MTQRKKINFLNESSHDQPQHRLNFFNFANINLLIKSVIEIQEKTLRTTLLEKSQLKDLEENKFILINCAIKKWTVQLKNTITDKIYFVGCVAEPHKHPQRSMDDIKKYEALIPIYNEQAVQCAKMIDDLAKQKPIIEEKLNNLAKEIIDIENQLVFIRKQKDSLNRSHLPTNQNSVVNHPPSEHKQDNFFIESILQKSQTQQKRRP